MSAPLLCELHAHTTWSDGVLSVPQLVDLYGGAGFDVLAVTDHVVRAEYAFGQGLSAAGHAAYLDELEREAERAAERYGLLVIPGLELTFDDPDPRQAAHAVAVGLRRYVALDDGLEAALAGARGNGAALIAAHPYALAEVGSRTTARFAEDPAWAAAAVDRFEVCNRHDFFAWVARERLPVVANGDFHRPEHLATWKTLLPAEKREDAVVDYLCSRGPVSLTALEPGRLARAEAA